MNAISIKEVREKVGQSVPSVTGRLKNLQPFKAGTSQKGKPYTNQVGYLTDGFQDIKFTKWYHKTPIDDSLIGKIVVINGGVKIQEEIYNGNKSIVLSVRGDIVEIIEGSEAPTTLKPAISNHTPSMESSDVSARLDTTPYVWEKPRYTNKELLNLYKLCQREACERKKDGSPEAMQTEAPKMASDLFWSYQKIGFKAPIQIDDVIENQELQEQPY